MTRRAFLALVLASAPVFAQDAREPPPPKKPPPKPPEKPPGKPKRDDVITKH